MAHCSAHFLQCLLGQADSASDNYSKQVRNASTEAMLGLSTDADLAHIYNQSYQQKQALPKVYSWSH